VIISISLKFFYKVQNLAEVPYGRSRGEAFGLGCTTSGNPPPPGGE
jgi:hypothetical protein